MSRTSANRLSKNFYYPIKAVGSGGVQHFRISLEDSLRVRMVQLITNIIILNLINEIYVSTIFDLPGLYIQRNIKLASKILQFI
jgi:hypothetical protein